MMSWSRRDVLRAAEGRRRIRTRTLFDDSHYVLVVRNMIKSNPLTFELDARPDDQGVFRIFPELRMNPLANIIQGRTGGQDQWMLHVRATISGFQVDPDKIKRRPYSIPENFHVNILLCGQRDIVTQVLLHGPKIFLVDQVNLVQNCQRRDIPSIPCHYIDQLIVRNVVSNDDTSVRYSVNLHDAFDRAG